MKKPILDFIESYLEEDAMESKALEFATKKHKGQKRKFGGKPYINHPIKVAEYCRKFGGSTDTIQAAYLHDTLEDTNTKYAELLRIFGPKVSGIVKEVTTEYGKDELDKMGGKAKVLTAKMNKMSSDALIVKLCDRLNNTDDFPSAPKKFVDKYRTETIYILQHLNRALNGIHKKIINAIEKNLK